MVSEANDARGRGRPRDPKVDEAILGATVAVLRERGWSGTTIEEVAARAGVGKTSIYRRYSSKVALVADAATRAREIVFPSFDTGSAAGDLMAFVLGSLRRLLGSVWQDVLPGVLAEAAEDPDVREVVKEAWSWRRASIGAIVARGIERGEIQPGTDPEHVLDMVDGPLLFRLMVTKAPLDYGFVDQLVDRIMRAVGSDWR